MSIMDEWLEKAKAAEKQRKAEAKASRPKGQKCSNCKFHQGHQFSPKYHYCMKGRSNKTSNGYATTKPGSWCQLWENT